MIKEEVVAIQASLTLSVKTSAPLFFFPAGWNGLGLSLSPFPPSHAIFTKSAYSEYVPGFRGVPLPSQSPFS